jgi:hypothetical protein
MAGSRDHRNCAATRRGCVDGDKEAAVPWFLNPRSAIVLVAVGLLVAVVWRSAAFELSGDGASVCSGPRLYFVGAGSLIAGGSVRERGKQPTAASR